MTVPRPFEFIVIILTVIGGLVFSVAALATPRANGIKATLPIVKRSPTTIRRRQPTSAAIGLGDFVDLGYSVELTIGSTTVPLLLDTGSSDMWSISTGCTDSSCGSIAGIPQISPSDLQASELPVQINYGAGSSDQTFAAGLIYSGSVSIAGLQMNDQFLAAVDETNTDIPEFFSVSGIFGTGFPDPSISAIFEVLLASKFANSMSPVDPAEVTDAFISAIPTQGPLLTRLVANGLLAQPMYTVTLQRETVEVGGNVGQLTIGQLPNGVSNDSLTWVPVRLYTESQGGIPGPTSSPNETYPSRWEIPIDDVLLNGQTLPKPTLPNNIGYTALIDTGNSIIRGPPDIVNSIFPSGSLPDPNLSCNFPVNMVFVIGGKNFPVDPRDFLGYQPNAGECTTDTVGLITAPSLGTLMSWVLGIPFIKSNLIAFYFGNLTHPSVDPPRIGLLSTVPSNADALLETDVTTADNGDGFFAATSTAAPTGTPPAAGTDAVGVAQASSTSSISSFIASSTLPVGPPSVISGTIPPMPFNGGRHNGLAHLEVLWLFIVTTAVAFWVQ